MSTNTDAILISNSAKSAFAHLCEISDEIRKQEDRHYTGPRDSQYLMMRASLRQQMYANALQTAHKIDVEERGLAASCAAMGSALNLKS